MNDSKEFSVIDVIVSFSWPERLGEIQAGIPISIGICLQEDATGCILGGICGDGEGF